MPDWSPAATTTSASPETGSEADVDLYEEQFPLTWQDALDMARKDFKGAVSKIELEPTDRGQYHYEIGLLSKSKKHAVQFDARSGDQVSKENDTLDADDKAERDKEIVDLDTVITVKKAMKTARKEQNQGPRAGNSNVTTGQARVMSSTRCSARGRGRPLGDCFTRLRRFIDPTLEVSQSVSTNVVVPPTAECLSCRLDRRTVTGTRSSSLEHLARDTGF